MGRIQLWERFAVVVDVGMRERLSSSSGTAWMQSR